MTKTNKIIIALTVVSILVAIVIGVMQYSKSSKITQSIQGDKNVQVIGDHNYVDNRTYVFELGINSQLSYLFSPVQHSRDRKYVTKLTIKAEGNIPAYNPKIYVRFSKVIQKGEFKLLRSPGFLSGIRFRGDSNSDEYFFTTDELKPGYGIEFFFCNDTRFDIVEFVINDKKQF